MGVHGLSTQRVETLPELILFIVELRDMYSKIITSHFEVEFIPNTNKIVLKTL